MPPPPGQRSSLEDPDGEGGPRNCPSSSSLLKTFLKGLEDVRKIDYVSWIRCNPQRASDVENGLKLISYLLHGRLGSDKGVGGGKVKVIGLLPELLYSSSHLLAFWHDSIIKSSLGGRADEAGAGGNSAVTSNSTSGHHHAQTPRERNVIRIQSTLTLMEYMEVFLEVGAKHLWGEPGKWLIIFIIQTLKVLLRSALLFYYKIGMLENPAIRPLDRGNGRSPGSNNKVKNSAFVLKHSGRVVRRVQGSASYMRRDWKVPKSPAQSCQLPHDLPPLRVLAEVIHLLRPMIHLIGMGAWGHGSWRPWVLSLGLDVASLQLHGPSTNMRIQEKMELSRRTYALLMYLLRSPFYDRFTKARIIGTLHYFSRKIPLFGSIGLLVAEAIPEWQGTYSYIWG